MGKYYSQRFATVTGVCSICMIRVNCRSTLGVLAGIMNRWGLVGYLRFCKLCKSHSKASLSTLLYCLFAAVTSLWW